jgi:hypothetical protein
VVGGGAVPPGRLPRAASAPADWRLGGGLAVFQLLTSGCSPADRRKAVAELSGGRTDGHHILDDLERRQLFMRTDDGEHYRYQCGPAVGHTGGERRPPLLWPAHRDIPSANSQVMTHWFFGADAPRTHRDHGLTCEYVMGQAPAEPGSAGFRRSKPWEFRSRNVNRYPQAAPHPAIMRT